jgi:hypothetical protein
MIGEQLCDEEAQNIRDLVKEVVKAPPQKTKKNTLQQRCPCTTSDFTGF